MNTNQVKISEKTGDIWVNASGIWIPTGYNVRDGSENPYISMPCNPDPPNSRCQPAPSAAAVATVAAVGATVAAVAATMALARSDAASDLAAAASNLAAAVTHFTDAIATKKDLSIFYGAIYAALDAVLAAAN